MEDLPFRILFLICNKYLILIKKIQKKYNFNFNISLSLLYLAEYKQKFNSFIRKTQMLEIK